MKSPLGSLLDRSLSDRLPVPMAPRRGSASGPYGSGIKSHAPNPEHLEAMGSVGTLFAIVNRLSTSVASVEWSLYRKNGIRADPSKGRTPVLKHAALDLWNKPNPFYTRNEFVESFQQHVDLTGEGYWVVSRAEGIDLPLQMWVVRPDRMKPVPSPEEFLSGYVYVGPDGDRIPLTLEEVIQVRMPNPLDPYRGMGPVQAILTNIDAVKYSDEWNANFFRNSAEPGGIIEVPDRLSDADFDEMRDRWNTSHRGVARAHRVAILENAKWVPNSFSQRDMQFVELRDVSREIIMEAFSMSKTMLGRTEDVNRATAEAALEMYARYQEVPRLNRIKQALNNDLLPMFGAAGEGVEFDYANPVPENDEADNQNLQVRTAAAVSLVGAGWNAEDVLDQLGLPPMRFEGRVSGPAQAPADASATGSATN